MYLFLFSTWSKYSLNGSLPFYLKFYSYTLSLCMLVFQLKPESRVTGGVFKVFQVY